MGSRLAEHPWTDRRLVLDRVRAREHDLGRRRCGQGRRIRGHGGQERRVVCWVARPSRAFGK